MLRPRWQIQAWVAAALEGIRVIADLKISKGKRALAEEQPSEGTQPEATLPEEGMDALTDKLYQSRPALKGDDLKKPNQWTPEQNEIMKAFHKDDFKDWHESKYLKNKMRAAHQKARQEKQKAESIAGDACVGRSGT